MACEYSDYTYTKLGCTDGYNSYYDSCCDVTLWRFWYSMMWISIFFCCVLLCIAMAKARAQRRQAYMQNRGMYGQQQPEVIVVNNGQVQSNNPWGGQGTAVGGGGNNGGYNQGGNGGYNQGGNGGYNQGGNGGYQPNYQPY